MPISHSPLSKAHLDEILEHEQEYPPVFRLGREKLEKKLSDLDDSHCSMSWILHETGKCVAYVVVYPQFSRLEQTQKERVIYVDDIFVKKGYEACLFRLIKLFTRSARELGLRDYPIEGACRVGAYRAFASHDPLLQRLGWELTQKSEYWDEASKEEMCWLRWEPLYEEAPRFHTADRVAVSSEAEKVAPQEKLVTLEESEAYAYVPRREERPDTDDPDEYSALTEIMIGKDEDDLVGLPPVPPVDKRELRDVFGILEFIGTRKFPRSERVKRKIRQARRRDG
ncbi:MAG: hypothetical protein WC314_18255 [Vulcanimicrobiota bacterium]